MLKYKLDFTALSIKCYHGNTGVPGTVDTQEEFDCPTDFNTCVKIDFKANGPPVGPHDTRTIRSCGLKEDREGMGMTADQCVTILTKINETYIYYYDSFLQKELCWYLLDMAWVVWQCETSL